MTDSPKTDEHSETSVRRISDDLLAILCAAVLLIVSFAAVWSAQSTSAEGEAVKLVSPLKGWVGKPAKWKESPVGAFVTAANASVLDQPWVGVVGTFLALGVLLAMAKSLQGESRRKFFVGFVGVFLLATIAYVFAANAVAKAYNLEYALWALGIGLLISNTIGTPWWLTPAVRTEFFIKTGLVLLGAEVLMSRLMALGLPGVCVAWVVTPIVLVSTYWFGQRVLKLESRSLNMVVSADMSVCGVSAAIASAAACKAKKEELSLAIGMSLSFTVVMMVILPICLLYTSPSPRDRG